VPLYPRAEELPVPDGLFEHEWTGLKCSTFLKWNNHTDRRPRRPTTATINTPSVHLIFAMQSSERLKTEICRAEGVFVPRVHTDLLRAESIGFASQAIGFRSEDGGKP